MRIFIDDSGSSDYSMPYSKEFTTNPPEFAEYEDFWRKNYFVLAAICIEDSNVPRLNSTINSIKNEYFGTNVVEIKSDWLRNPQQRKKRYIDKYGISSDKLNEFGETVIDFVSANHEVVKVISTVFDKRCYGEKLRSSVDGNPLVKSAQVMFERIQYLGFPKTSVFFDQMESSLRLTKGRNGQILRVLQNRYELKQIFVGEYTNIEKIGFKKSESENFLQLADVCAYNVYRQFVAYGRSLSQVGLNFKENYGYFEKIVPNFQNKGERIRGIGLIVLPDINKKASVT